MATRPRTSFSEIQEYMGFESQANRADRHIMDNLAALRDIWTMCAAHLPKWYIPGRIKKLSEGDTVSDDSLFVSAEYDTTYLVDLWCKNDFKAQVIWIRTFLNVYQR